MFIFSTTGRGCAIKRKVMLRLLFNEYVLVSPPDILKLSTPAVHIFRSYIITTVFCVCVCVFFSLKNVVFWSRLLAAKTNGKVLFSEVQRMRVEAGKRE